MRTTLLPVAAAAVISIAALTGCGGGDDSAGDFCSKVEEIQKSDSSDVSQDDAKDMLKDLQDSAPDDLKAEFDEARDGLDVNPDDLADLDSPDVEEQMKKAQDAFKKIETYVKDKCDIDLG